MKTCKKCNGTRFTPVKRTNYKTGQIYMSSKCMDCANSYQKKSGVVSKWQKANNKHIREYQTEYYGSENRYRVRNAKHSKTLKQRTFGSKKDIIEFYKNCPNGYEVDHIVPINGRNVSGLHTIDNLQYLTIEDNRKKSNKY